MNDPELLQILQLLAALIMAVLAFWEKRRADTAEDQTDSVIAFYDLNNDAVVVPPSIVPSRSWKMNDETRQMIFRGRTAQEKASLIQQIDEAERKNLVDYTIAGTTAYHHINYGLVAGGE
jgi:hypothetical protein